MTTNENNNSSCGGGCECQTGDRRLAVLSHELLEGFSDLIACADSLDWELDRDLQVLAIDIGPSHPWTTAAELVNFIRTIVAPDRFEVLRAAWLHPTLPVRQQAAALIHAVPISTLAAVDKAQLLPILQRKAIETWFQPIIRQKDGGIWGYECLMRARADDGSLLSPATLINWAKRENLVFMLDRVCRETHLLNAGLAGLPSDVFITINFLPTSIYKPEYCLRTTLAAAAKSGISPSRIFFEVIETEKVEDHEFLRGILAFYRKEGFGIALDDIGTGHAGLALLGELNPDLIKIARELVVRAETSPMHHAICESLVQMGHKLDRLVLAEGIETDAQCSMMSAMGVDLFQGFLFGKPAPVPAKAALTAVSR